MMSSLGKGKEEKLIALIESCKLLRDKCFLLLWIQDCKQKHKLMNV